MVAVLLLLVSSWAWSVAEQQQTADKPATAIARGCSVKGLLVACFIVVSLYFSRIYGYGIPRQWP
jgi:hypothetical protein